MAPLNPLQDMSLASRATLSVISGARVKVKHLELLKQTQCCFHSELKVLLFNRVDLPSCPREDIRAGTFMSLISSYYFRNAFYVIMTPDVAFTYQWRLKVWNDVVEQNGTLYCGKYVLGLILYTIFCN